MTATKDVIRIPLQLILIAIICSGCSPKSCLLEPKLSYTPQTRCFEAMHSPFPPLSPLEKKQDWGKELAIGISFAKEMDLYRAITAFKRALILIPNDKEERKLQIQYNLVLCYYIGGKYQDALDIFEKTSLYFVPMTFPTRDDLLLMIYDCYTKTDQEEKACIIFDFLENQLPEKARDIKLSEAFFEGDLCAITEAAYTYPNRESLTCFLDAYSLETKSVQKAQTLNAVIPGAGYYYVGQEKAALTSFIINTLFIATAYEFFDRGYWAAGIITSSLELGWYIGGINGAGLAAKEYNERLFERNARPLMIQNRLFPVLRLEHSF